MNKIIEQPIIVDLSNIKVGDIILFHTDFNRHNLMSLLSVAIDGFTHDDYSHASIVSQDDKGNLTLCQMLINGCNSDLLSTQIINENIKIIRYKVLDPLFDDEKATLVKRINSKIGIKYDFVGLLIDQPILQLTEDIDPNSEIWLGRKDSVSCECSTYTAWCLEYPNWWDCTPANFDKAIDFFTTISQGHVIKIV
jgi:hypothetical protein